jgi:hypothetical protein
MTHFFRVEHPRVPLFALTSSPTPTPTPTPTSPPTSPPTSLPFLALHKSSTFSTQNYGAVKGLFTRHSFGIRALFKIDSFPRKNTPFSTIFCKLTLLVVLSERCPKCLQQKDPLGNVSSVSTNRSKNKHLHFRTLTEIVNIVAFNLGNSMHD